MVNSRASSPLSKTKTSRDPGPFAETPPRKKEASTKMNSCAIVQDKLHPLRHLKVRYRQTTPQEENEALAWMSSIASVQGTLLLLRHLQVWLRPMPRREIEASDSVNSRASSPQAQRKIRNLANITRNLGPFAWVRIQSGL
jgi:hypothetical protein